MKRLIQIEGNNIIRQIPLKRNEYTLGRGAENDVVFDTPKVSRLHAVLIAEGDTYCIVDKDSTNRVFVNGEQVKRRRLTSGDEINLSREVTLLYLSESDADEKIAQMLNRLWTAINKKDLLRLKEVTSRIISLDSLDHILNVILTEVVKLVDAERGFIALTDEKGEIRTDTSVVYNIPLKVGGLVGGLSRDRSVFSHSTVRRAIQNRENIFILSAADDEEYLSNSIVELDLQSIMCSPLLFGDKLVGILYVDSGYQLSDFNEMDQFFFTILADHAAITIENAKLYSRVQMSIEQLREEVQESEERYRQLVELSPEAIAVHSEGKIVFVNAAAMKLIGAEKSEDIIGKPAMGMVHPDYRDIVRERIRQELEEGKQASLLEERFLRLDGSSVDVEVVGAPLVYQGKPAVLVIARDITYRKRMEQELRRAQKLESVGVLAGGIAHDFNNILTAIWGNIGLAKTLVEPGDEVFERLTEAEKASLRAKGLTQQLLTFSKGGAPIKTTASIAELIKDSVSFALRGSNVRCEFSIPDGLWSVEVDEGQMSQVINNLVINADQAMPEGGTIGVRAENVTLGAQQAVPLAEGKYVKISIEDQGIGIAEEHLPKIFDPYFTTKQKGSGLGLAISYSILKNHNGYITVESKLGVGTTFHVYLPASEKEVLIEEKVEEIPFVGKGKILVMDDEAVVRGVAGRMLSHIGYEVEFAQDGAEAIELYKKAKESGQPFDAVIMDLTIPGGMGGKEAIKKLVVIDSKVKAIVSSGYSTDPIMADFREYGFSGVIAKPYRIRELGDALYSVISGMDNHFSS